MSRDPALARRLWKRFELIHAVTYFSSEPLAALREAGYKGFWMGYFAARAAPLGAAPPEVVLATFYNFAESRVRGAIPDAWGFAGPERALDARLDGSVAALRRILGGDVSGDVATVAASARRAAESAPVAGRPLFAANAALPWPDEPLADLWHASTLLREHRGDGHIALLTAAGIAGREANVLHFTSVGAPPQIRVIGRDYDDAEWNANITSLTERGLMTGDGRLTASGEALKRDVEAQTDLIALSAYAALSDDEIADLVQGLGPIADAVIAAGEFPAMTPIGPLTAIDD